MSWLISNALMADYENSRSLREQAAESLAASCSAGALSVQLNVMPTLRPFWRRDKMTGSLSPFPSGLTLRLLTDDLGADLLTWYRQGFHARTSALLEREPDLTAQSRDSGEKSSGSFATFNRATSSWRTRQTFLISDLEPSLQIWPRWGSMRGGECWEQSMPVLHTRAIACGLWPTPSGVKSSKNHGNGSIGEWGGSGNRFRGTPLQNVHCPSFEEWMMGWPAMWTELTPLAMDKFRQWLHSHGASLEASKCASPR